MTELEIDRSKWLCGHELNRDTTKESMLLAQDGMMCCLGFLGKAVGGTGEMLRGSFIPDACLCVPWPKGVLTEDDKDTQWTAVAVRVNDSKSLSDSDRESILIDHFKGINIRVTFSGNYLDSKYNGLPTV